MSLFKIKEIIKMGIDKEKKRRDFYGKVKGLYDNEKLAQLFSDLEKWEAEHIDTFKKIYDSVGEEQTCRESYEGEMEDYIDAFLDDRLYYEIETDIFKDRIKTERDAIHLAMSFEKDAIIFFNEFKDMAPPEHKVEIQKLLNEEKQHLIFLYRMKKELDK